MRDRRRIGKIVGAVAFALALLVGDTVSGAAVRASRRPIQFTRPAPVGVSGTGGRLAVVAHNAGDDPRTAARALAAGQAIEIDVVFRDGRLYAAHNGPRSWTGRLVWRLAPAPSLAAAWDWTRGARMVELDLKSTSPEAVGAVVAFLDGHRDARDIVVSAGDPDALRAIVAAVPDVQVFLSISQPAFLATIRADPSRARGLNGVCLRVDLLDAATVDWLHARGLRVLAWTVDDWAQRERLTGLGVDAIASRNLAFAAGDSWPAQ